MGGHSPSSDARLPRWLRSPAAPAVAEATSAYRPRHPERTSIYRIFEKRFQSCVGTCDERFEPREGPLRAALFAETLAGEIAAPVTHRHLVFTIPKALRGLFQRERSLLGLLPRCAYEAVRRAFAAYLGDRASP